MRALRAGRLGNRLRKLMRLRWVRGLTLEEVGRHLGVTRERVWQLEGKAMARMREVLGVGSG